MNIETRHGPMAVTLDGDAASGLVVLLHGLGADHRQSLDFTPSAAALGPRWQRAAVDFRGHGDTETLGGPETLSFAAYADDVADVISALTAEWVTEVVVVGMSMGAEVALQLADRRPDLIDRVVLVRPARPLGFAPAYLATAYEQLYESLQKGTIGRQSFLNSAAYAAVAADSPATARSLAGQFDRAYAAERAPVIAAFADLDGLEPSRLASIDLPVLVLATPEDPAHPLACGELLAELLPQAAPLIVLPPKGTEPEAYATALRDATAVFITNRPTAP